MIHPNEIRKKAERKYETPYLQSVVNDLPFTEIVIIGNKKTSDNFTDFDKEISKLIDNSKEKKGYGYSVKWQTVKKKNLGTQDIPVEISFQSEYDFLKYLNKEKEVSEFHKNRDLILSNFPELKDWICKNPLKIIKHHPKWNDIMLVCNYFKTTPKPNMYIRELPIWVHTKFVEENKGIIRELLDILIQEHVQHDEKDFEKRFNLKYVEPTVRFRILDKKISKDYFSGIDDLSITVSQFEELNLPIKRVLVVENKTNLLTVTENLALSLTLPEMEATIVIFGSGYKVEILKNVTWFNQIELLYWGDIDAQGFEILSQFRGHFLHVESIFMDKETYEAFESDVVDGTEKENSAPNLTPEEHELYADLKENNKRLEQEKISYEYVGKFFEKKFATSKKSITFAP